MFFEALSKIRKLDDNLAVFGSFAEQLPLGYNQVFRKLTKLAILTSEALLREKKASGKMLPSVGIEPRQPLILSPTLSFLH